MNQSTIKTATRVFSVVAALGLFGTSCGSSNAGSDAGSDDSTAETAGLSFCDQMTELTGLDPLAGVDITAANAGEAITLAFNEMDAAFAGLADSAPDELAGDIALMGEGISTLAAALDDAGGDLFALAADPAMAEQLEKLDSPEFDEAAANVEEYVSAECGIELN